MANKARMLSIDGDDRARHTEVNMPPSGQRLAVDTKRKYVLYGHGEKVSICKIWIYKL